MGVIHQFVVVVFGHSCNGALSLDGVLGALNRDISTNPTKLMSNVHLGIGKLKDAYLEFIQKSEHII